MDAIWGSLTEAELLIARSAEPSALAELDEDDLRRASTVPGIARNG